MGEQPLLAGGRTWRANPVLVGKSHAMEQLRYTISRVAMSDATVLITGASGTGKENVARSVHAASPWADGVFQAVNCGAIPAELAEAELFGAEAGAFTGANKRRIGLIEAAQGGTLFLDEVGELPLAIQVKLLRVLETREFTRLGGRDVIPVNFRLIAATNVDLERAVSTKQFREDLYWRLAVVQIALEPLVNRLEDIPDLITYFSQGRLSLMADAEAVLGTHNWPGNLRELRNLVERAMAFGEICLSADGFLKFLHPKRQDMSCWLKEDLTKKSARGSRVFDQMLVQAATVEPVDLKDLLTEAEMQIIQQSLEASNGVVSETARRLGLKRTTLIEKMKRFGLKFESETV